MYFILKVKSPPRITVDDHSPWMTKSFILDTRHREVCVFDIDDTWWQDKLFPRKPRGRGSGPETPWRQ